MTKGELSSNPQASAGTRDAADPVPPPLVSPPPVTQPRVTPSVAPPPASPPGNVADKPAPAAELVKPPPLPQRRPAARDADELPVSNVESRWRDDPAETDPPGESDQADSTPSDLQDAVANDAVVEAQDADLLENVTDAVDELENEQADELADDVDAEAEDASDDEQWDAMSERRWWQKWSVLRNTEALMGSVFAHLILFVALAIWMLPEVVHEMQNAIVVDMPSQEDEALEELSQTAIENTTVSILSAESMTGVAGSASGMVAAPSLDPTLVESLSTGGSEVKISHPLDQAPSSRQLIEATPYSTLGDARVIVANYDDAFDRITQEILWMLAESNVLVTWCFDQSESMKDDQQEIRSRIRHVYGELGLTGKVNNEALMTAVTSYGQGYLQHTKLPTSDVEAIESAMDNVPIDPSGKEFMCQAVTLSIAHHLKYVKQSHRQMALIVVTDESGERQSNVQLLEQAIAAAREAHCRIFVLGREAVFGYPYAHMKWKHPYTGHVHWLPIDRGPETAFVEQLQTEGFRRRHDAHPSGFGPYEQARMARETGGIFFMLPSLETDLVRGEKGLYELEAMRPYLPNLEFRAKQLAERDESILRSMLSKVINDLNPYRESVAEVMEVRYDFSAQPPRFLVESREEQAKAKFYLQYLVAAEQALSKISQYREQEVSPRWQANYDLIYAQVLAYIARTYEYGAYLEAFISNPKVVPLEKPKFLRLSRWHVKHSKTTVGGPLTSSYIARADEMFRNVIEQHAGTPWAARAQWELSRGFGYELQERYSYYGPRPPRPPSRSVPKIPIPKL